MWPAILPSSALFFLTSLVTATPSARSNCIGTVSSLDDVNNAVQCKTVNINPFTVPAGKTFALNLLDGATVNVLGDIQFGNKSWAGPLFQVTGEGITFNGNNKKWDGGGPFYWDGRGTGGGITKPHPMMLLEISGALNDVFVVNSPAHCFAVSNQGPLMISGVTVDNSMGNYPNSKSNGISAGHNTDGFDVCGSDLIIRNSTVINQDDCLAINSGSNITFAANYCRGGHGASIGSIASQTVVSDVYIAGNNIVDSMYSFRIKTDTSATNSSVSNITYSGNTATNCTEFGVLITQSYPSNLGTPGNGVIISNVNFNPGTTTVVVDNGAYGAAVNCGSGSCRGIWDWSGLKISGGKNQLSGSGSVITGFS